MSAPVSEAAGFPVNESQPFTTYDHVVMEVPGRPVPLTVKVSAPVTGTDLPILLLSHGHGEATFLSSMRGYGPLVDFWTAHGFVVVQPTHLDSVALGLRDGDHPEAPLFWRTRAQDMHHILDHFDEIESTVPGLAGRVDRDRIVAAGHSLGGNTVGLLLGMTAQADDDPGQRDLSDPRIKAGVIFASPGVGDEYLAPYARDHYVMNNYIDYSTMTGQALVFFGDHDLNWNFSSRLSYRSDAYFRSPGPKDLITVFGAEHMFGGISGWDTAECSDPDPERVSAVRALAWAYLWTKVNPED